MSFNVNVPENIEQDLRRAFGQDLSRAALEALVVEGYRCRKFGIGQVTKLLALPSRFDAEGWLAAHGVHANYSFDDLEVDRNNLAALFDNQE